MRCGTYKRLLAALGSLICLASCSSLPTSASRWTVAAPPTVTAWVLAETLRTEFPTADPEPGHGAAPVVSEGGEQFTLDYRRGTGGVRVAMNGRLAPPELIISDQYAAFGVPSFLPDQSYTAARGSVEWAILWVGPAADDSPEARRTEVEIYLGGTPVRDRVQAHVERAIDLLEACCRTADLAHSGDFTELAKALQRVFGKGSTGCCAGHRHLLAPLHVHRATLFNARHRPQEARIALERALDHAPWSASLRASLAGLDERLAWPESARDRWIYLAHDRRFGPLGYAIAARVGRELNRDSANTSGQRELNRSYERLQAGDLDGALAWARRARAQGDNTAQTLQIAAQVHRHRGDHSTALALGLAQLAATGDLNLVPGLCEDCLALGEPAVALRLLARYWSQLQIQQPSASREMLERARSRVPDDLALRIMASEHQDRLTGDLLDAQPGRTAAGLALLRRLPSLRKRTVEKDFRTDTEARPRPDYEHAPGISPPR